jgi:Zn-dependent peptidase ImmA (M78 family)
MPDEIFVGERLQLAREFRGLTQKQLGKEVAASHALISLCETGKKPAPAKDLIEACGDILGFEQRFFYEQLADRFREEECSFRHRRSMPERMKAQIRAHGTLIGMVVDRLRSLFRFPPLNLPAFPARTNEDIELAAEQSRTHWKLDLNSPILQIGRVLEHAGVIIVPHVVQSTKVDAFSRQGQTSIIFLNQTIKSTSRWVFDIAHECGHLVMHQGIHTGSSETEAAADRYASAFLLPRRAFGREFSAAPKFSWEHIFGLKRRWHVSAAAIIRRAYDLGLLGAAGYRQAYKYLSFKGWTKGEPYEPTFQPPELLATALQALGTRVELTAAALCNDLRLRPNTFQDITGIAIPIPKGKPVILFPSLA